jgi:ribosome-associated protein
LRIVAGEYRSQQQNRRAALERLVGIVERALVVQKSRKATKPTRGSVERRLTDKRQRSDTKRGRRKDGHD